MAEGVRRIQDVEAAAPPLGVGPSRQQVANQRFAGGNQLIGQDVPGSHLEPAVGDECAGAGFLVRANRQVILQQDGLSVEHEAPEAGLALHPGDEVVECGDQAAHELGAREVPLPIPVRVGNQVVRALGHANKLGSQP